MPIDGNSNHGLLIRLGYPSNKREHTNQAISNSYFDSDQISRTTIRKKVLPEQSTRVPRARLVNEVAKSTSISYDGSKYYGVPLGVGDNVVAGDGDSETGIGDISVGEGVAVRVGDGFGFGFGFFTMVGGVISIGSLPPM